MKIHGNKPPEGQEINRAARNLEKPEIRGKAVSGPNKALTDKVEISSKGKEVASLMSAINQMPEVREDKIKAIQHALTSGAYKIDPRRIAEKILKEI
jgi:flagellar biosynthesis anti-sigma factor FlgM